MGQWIVAPIVKCVAVGTGTHRKKRRVRSEINDIRVFKLLFHGVSEHYCDLPIISINTGDTSIWPADSLDRKPTYLILTFILHNYLSINIVNELTNIICLL